MKIGISKTVSGKHIIELDGEDNVILVDKSKTVIYIDASIVTNEDFEPFIHDNYGACLPKDQMNAIRTAINSGKEFRLKVEYLLKEE